MSIRSLNWFIILILVGAISWMRADLPAGGVVEICDNGIDDDGDGLIDCFDDQCSCTEPCLSEHYFYPCEDSCEIRPDCAQFNATLKWESNVNVGSYPVLVAGDIDRDDVPEIVTYESETSRIVIINGTNGIAERFISAPGTLKGGMAPALADLNMDGFGDIIVVTDDLDLVAYSYDGTTIFHSPGVVGYDNSYAYAVIGVADFDQDGTAEIYIGNQIFSNTGQLIAEGGPSNAQGIHPERAGDFAFNSTVAVDAISSSSCPECGGLELVAGNQVYVVDIQNKTMNVYQEIQSFTDGYTSVADINLDGQLDAVIQGMRNGQKCVYGWDLASGSLLGSFDYVAGLQNGASRINIGDLNGDGRLEMCFSAHPAFYALDDQFNVLWQIPIYDGSSVTASTIFDFCGDGEAKILYRDEVELRVIDGMTGSVIWRYPCESNTFIENPLVLDVDADDQTDICVVCGPMFSRGRVYALSPSGGNWAKTRKVWNQHGYFNVNINDDLSVPRIQQNPQIVFDSLVLNGFMNQYASFDFRAVDLEIGNTQITCSQDSLRIDFQICNNGGLVTTSTYNAWILNENLTQSRSGNIVSSRSFNRMLDPDSCIRSSWKVPVASIQDSAYLVVNANAGRLGTGDPNSVFPLGRLTECEYGNNSAAIDLSYWIDDNFIDEQSVDVCQDEAILLSGNNGLTYTWYYQDSLICADCGQVSFTPSRSGWVYLENDGICGLDSVQVTISPQLTRNISRTICEGDSLQFGQLYLKSSGQYQRTGISSVGCDTIVTLDLIVDRAISLNISGSVCPGDSFAYRNVMYPPGSYDLTFPKVIGCDTAVQLTVIPLQIPQVSWSIDRDCDDRGTVRLDLDPVDSIMAVEIGNYFYLGEDEILADTGSQTLRVIFMNGCEDEFSLTIEGYPEIEAMAFPEICEGEANGAIRAEPAGMISYIEWNGINYNGNSINEVPAGSYQIRVADTLGCLKDFDIYVRPGSRPTASIEEVFVVPFGQSRILPLLTNGNAPLTIQWFPPDNLSCSNCDAPVFSGTEDQDFSIMVMDSSGCMTESRTSVRIDFLKKVFIPNAFTPNGDGINDLFFPEMAPGVRDILTLNIYNRWGGLIYSMPSGGTGWDGSVNGKMMEPGVFVYRCEVEFADGSRQQYSGDVTLIR